MKSNLLILLCIIFTQAFGQTLPKENYDRIKKSDSLYYDIIKKADSLFIASPGFALKQRYNFSETILSELSKDTTKDRKYQRAAKMLSFINDYKNTLAVWDSGVDKANKLRPGDSLSFLQFKPKNAKDFIVERARKEQIIILNEAHHQPCHRVFTETLLADLYKEGYRYFGAETLGYSDTSLNQRKHPVLWSGYYTWQPQYGNLVRTALQEGFYVFRYEGDGNGREREIDQAKNIKAILDTNPQAKIIIHCGYGHLSEGEHPTLGKLLAGRLKEFTGIDPFTISQTDWTERSSPEYENPLFRIINLDYYAVFVDSSGNLFNGIPHHNQYDIRVYHPRSKWIDGRPHWVFENGRQSFFVNKQITVSYPCLVFAYHAEENYPSAVAADIIELKNKDDTVALSLRRGEYNIVIKDAKGNEQIVKVKTNP